MVDRKCQLHRMMLTALAICGAAAESSAEMRISFDERVSQETLLAFAGVLREIAVRRGQRSGL